MKFTGPSAQHKGCRQRGVTWIELCVVLAIAALLTTTAAPGMRGLIDTRRLEGAAAQLATDIQLARTESVARNEPLRLSFQTMAAGSCYVIHSGTANQCHCNATGAALCTGDAREIKTVTLAAQDDVSLQANVNSIVFEPLHGTSSPTGTLRLVGTQGRAIHHVVNLMGRTRSCSPGASMPAYPSC